MPDPTPHPTPEPTSKPEPDPVVPVLQEDPMTFEEALDVATRLAPGVVAPSDCQPPPLDRPELLPNSPRGYRWGTHQGVDFPCWGADNEALAAMDGRVIVAVGDFQTPSSAEFAEILEVTRQLRATPPYTLIMLYGNYVVLDHGVVDGVGHVISIYTHLASLDPTIRIGGLVEAGQALGLIGNSGSSQAAAGYPDQAIHLHWELHIDNQYLGAGLSTEQTSDVYAALFAGSPESGEQASTDTQKVSP